jgi:predicted site-specific integrase-resolvase
MVKVQMLPSGAVRESFGGISPITLTRWVVRGLLPQPTKINGRNYWPAEAVQRLKDGQLGTDGAE